MTVTAPVVRTRYPGLDTLRAIAAIAVVGTHTSFWAGSYSHGTLGMASQRLEVGVAIFFVLSGFLLSMPWFASQRGHRPHDSTGRYFWKRALRILPVYWMTVVAAMLLLKDNRHLGASRWVLNLLLLDLYKSDSLPHGLTQMWSLTTEAAFYIVLPALMWLALVAISRRQWRPNRLFLALIGLGAANVAWTGFVTSHVSTFDGWANRWLVSYLLWFSIGIMFAIIAVDLPSPKSFLSPKVAALATSPLTCWSIALSVFFLASTPLAGSPELVVIAPHEAVTRTLLYAVVATMIVVPSIFGDQDSTYARVLALRPLRHLGHISYSLFCCHVIVLELVSNWTRYQLFRGHALELFALTLGISLIVAELMYQLIEKPFLRLKDRPPPKAFDSRTPRTTATIS